MRKIILITMAAIFAVGVMAQQKLRVWKNHSLAYEEDVTQIDSITFFNDSPIEQSKTEYMWLECNQDFLINWNNDYCNIEFSLDKSTWTTAVPTSANSLETLTQIPANTKVYLRGVNGSTNSFWGSDWWGFMRTTTTSLYNSGIRNPWAPTSDELTGIELKTGGNVLSLVFGAEFVEHTNDVVYSTLSRIFFWMGMLTDASQLYFAPATYGTNTGSFHSYGNQAGPFKRCYNLQKGPYIKYLMDGTFTSCESLEEIYYIGDGSEITNANSWYTTSTDVGNPGEERITSSAVETLTIHVKPGVSIPYKPANAVVVEDLE